MQRRFACLVGLVAPTGIEALRKLVAGQLASSCSWTDPARDELIEALHRQHGKGIAAILIYGSYLRGKRDTLLDFYVLLENYSAMPSRWQGVLAWLLSPNVYQVRCGTGASERRAKYALMTVGRFRHAMRRDFHSYFWARFAQPSGLLYCRDETTRELVVDAIADAARKFVGRVMPKLDVGFGAADLMKRGLELSYGAELRSEPAAHASGLYAHDAEYYEAILAILATQDLGFEPLGVSGSGSKACYRNLSSAMQRAMSSMAWALRAAAGKLLSVLRLLKATFTFEDGFDYVLWKIERHSGVRVEASPRQRRHPLIFGWPVLIRLYRQGGFQ